MKKIKLPTQFGSRPEIVFLERLMFEGSQIADGGL